MLGRIGDSLRLVRRGLSDLALLTETGCEDQGVGKRSAGGDLRIDGMRFSSKSGTETAHRQRIETARIVPYRSFLRAFRRSKGVIFMN